MHIVAFRICLLQIINQLGSPRSPDPDHVVPYIWQNLAPVRKMQTLHKSQTTKHKLLSRHGLSIFPRYCLKPLATITYDYFIDYAKPANVPNENFNRDSYGWLCDIINRFGDQQGFEKISNYFTPSKDQTSDQNTSSLLNARSMAALLQPIANAAPVLMKENIKSVISSCVEKSFVYVEKMDDQDLKSKEITAVSDLLTAIKTLCHYFWPKFVDNCDQLRLSMINRMLKTPQFNSRMNALKEVSRLIEESEKQTSKAGPVNSMNRRNEYF